MAYETLLLAITLMSLFAAFWASIKPWAHCIAGELNHNYIRHTKIATSRDLLFYGIFERSILNHTALFQHACQFGGNASFYCSTSAKLDCVSCLCMVARAMAWYS